VGNRGELAILCEALRANKVFGDGGHN
jgi:hypothetical protein